MKRVLMLALILGIAALVPLAAQSPQERLWDAAQSGDTAAVRAALDAGARVDSIDVRRNPNGRRALNWAAWFNHADVIRLLLAKGASIDARNNTGFTALHHAAENGSLEAARVLLEAGANPIIPNDNGLNPVETARNFGHDDVAQLLAEAERRHGQP